MGKYVNLPKPVYAIKPVVYAVGGLIAAAAPIDPIFKVAGLLFFCLGVGFGLNRLQTPLNDRD